MAIDIFFCSVPNNFAKNHDLEEDGFIPVVGAISIKGFGIASLRPKGSKV